MTPKQRVILTQLQLTGLGVIFLGFGIAWKKTWLVLFGIALGLYGLARLFVLNKLLAKSEDQYAQMQDQTSANHQTTNDVDEDPKGEYAKDEWESKLESYLEKRYENPYLDLEDSQTKPKTKQK